MLKIRRADTFNQFTKEELILDMNHPLAGKALNFKIKIVGIE